MHNKPSVSSFLGGVAIQRTILKCSGVKVCQNPAEYVTASHTSWSGRDFLRKRDATHKAQQVFAEEYNIWTGQKETIEYITTALYL
jgi:acyl-CoA synthetase (NDP forming)